MRCQILSGVPGALPVVLRELPNKLGPVLVGHVRKVASYHIVYRVLDQHRPVASAGRLVHPVPLADNPRDFVRVNLGLTKHPFHHQIRSGRSEHDMRVGTLVEHPTERLTGYPVRVPVRLANNAPTGVVSPSPDHPVKNAEPAGKLTDVVCEHRRVGRHEGLPDGVLVGVTTNHAGENPCADRAVSDEDAFQEVGGLIRLVCDPGDSRVVTEEEPHYVFRGLPAGRSEPSTTAVGANQHVGDRHTVRVLVEKILPNLPGGDVVNLIRVPGDNRPAARMGGMGDSDTSLSGGVCENVIHPSKHPVEPATFAEIPFPPGELGHKPVCDTALTAC